jgi:hypothetical protein
MKIIKLLRPVFFYHWSQDLFLTILEFSADTYLLSILER